MWRNDFKKVSTDQEKKPLIVMWEKKTPTRWTAGQ